MIGKKKVNMLDDFEPRPPKKKRHSYNLGGGIEERNNALLHRYYYYVAIHKSAYDEAMKFLIRDFYLTDKRLSDLIVQNSDKMQEIKKAAPGLKRLIELFPTYSWVAPQKKKPI